MAVLSQLELSALKDWCELFDLPFQEEKMKEEEEKAVRIKEKAELMVRIDERHRRWMEAAHERIARNDRDIVTFNTMYRRLRHLRTGKEASATIDNDNAKRQRLK